MTTQGALIFAFDGRIKYTTIAQEAARRVRQYLHVPTTLVTDVPLQDPHDFDQVITIERPPGTHRYWQDRDRSAIWHNRSRYQAWDLSPYDRTLLIDADYWLCSDRISVLMHSRQPLLCHKTALDLPSPGQTITQRFAKKPLDQWWATAVIFDRSEYCQDIFRCWGMIDENYDHYAAMFGFSGETFRNDYALSLSILMCNGHITSGATEIPWPLINIMPDATVTEKDHGWEVSWTPRREKKTPGRVIMYDLDLHFMCKNYLEHYVNSRIPDDKTNA